MKPVDSILALAVVALPNSVVAKERTFEEAAEAAIQGIADGRDLTGLDIFHANYEHDATRVAALKGCKYTLLPGSSRYVLKLDWSCPDASNSVYTGVYISDGTLSRLDFQPIVSQMTPTAKALALAEIDSPKSINRRFSKAVRNGEDPTLDGIIPISPEYLEKLSGMKGWSAETTKAENDRVVEQYWMKRAQTAGDAAMTTLHFDEEGRPIGLWLGEMKVAIQKVSM